MNRKIVILGNADSFWLQRYIDNVSLPLNHNVTLISATNNQYRDYYAKKKVLVITTKPEKMGILGHRVNALKTTVNTLKEIKKVSPDIIHVHYAYPYIMRILPFVSKKRKKIITFWGSDLLRADKKEYKLIKKAACISHSLVVGAEDLFYRLIELDHGFEAKTEIIRMGLTAFDSIDAKRNYAIESKIHFLGKANQGKIIITIGYNASKAQQHLSVLKKISELSDEIKQKLMVVLPLTYQNEDKTYLNEIDQVLKDSGINGFLLKEFMDDDHIAELCLSTDIFINAQTTDAISASMLEHLYSGSLVLNGRWLKYPFIDDNNIQCVKFDDFNDMKMIILKLITDGQISYDKSTVASIVKENFSWNSSRQKWKMVYDSVLK